MSSKPTEMPEWLEKQFTSAERIIDTWSDGKCEAAGIPRNKRTQMDTMNETMDKLTIQEKSSMIKECYDMYVRMLEAWTSWENVGVDIEAEFPSRAWQSLEKAIAVTEKITGSGDYLSWFIWDKPSPTGLVISNESEYEITTIDDLIEFLSKDVWTDSSGAEACATSVRRGSLWKQQETGEWIYDCKNSHLVVKQSVTGKYESSVSFGGIWEVGYSGDHETASEAMMSAQDRLIELMLSNLKEVFDDFGI